MMNYLLSYIILTLCVEVVNYGCSLDFFYFLDVFEVFISPVLGRVNE